MRQFNFAFPRPLSRVVAHLPTLPPSFAFTSILNLALKRIIRSGDLALLHGKHIAIRVTDVGLHLHFTVSRTGFSPIRAKATEPDLAISATAHDFYLLATRQEDPDTLFFSRRLVVEGSTELGLVAKNTLDSLDLPTLDWAMLAPGHVLTQLKGHFL